jgi:CHAT domain-containing protein/tetratricopeptide (TPR) repeat protein
MPTRKCPSPKILQASSEGRLDATAHRQVTEHMTNCGVCRDLLLALDDRKTRTSSIKRSFVTVLVVAVAATFAWIARERWFPVRAISKVANAAETLSAWPLEGRLSGDFPELPMQVATRATVPVPSDSYELQRVRSELAREHRSPDNLHGLGLAELLLGEEDRAVAALSSSLLMATGRRELQAAIAQSADATLLSNLSAALLQRARNSNSARDSVLAFECADRAWSLEKARETAWNRAAAIENLRIPADATEAWEEYLRLDLGSRWTSTAKTKLELLRSPWPAAGWDVASKDLETAARASDADRLRTIVNAFPGKAREQVENQLLPCWADAVLSGASETAKDCLDRARVIAAALQDVQRDSLLIESVHAIDRSSGRRLAQAHALYERARSAYKAGKFADARRGYETAGKLFKAAQSPYAFLAGAYVAGMAYGLNDYDKAVEQIADLLRTTPDVSRFPSAQGRARWTSANSNSFLGRYDAAIAEHNAALTLFRDSREDHLALSIQEMLAGVYEMMGDRDRALSARLEALAAVAESGQRDHLQQTLAGGARIAQRYGFPALSRLLTRRELAATRQQPPNPGRAAALSRLAQLSRTDGDTRAAAYYASLAWDVATQIEEPASRQFAMSDPNVLRAVLPEMNGARRLELLQGAAAAAVEKKNRYWGVETNLLMSREQARHGDADAAIEALTEAFRSVDIQEQSIENLYARDLILDEYRSANRDLLALLVQRGHIIDALVQAERNRARTVGSGALDATEVQTESDLRALQRAIPAGTAVVYYATLDDRMMSWLMTSDRIALFQHIVSRERVRAGAEALSEAEEGQFVAAAADASQWLVAPWIDAVSPTISTLVFVTDDETANVPFNALIARSSMLIERFGILTAPSLAVYTAAHEREMQLRSNTGAPLLVVAAVEGREDRNLEPLVRGRREVDRLRTRSHVQVLDDATRGSVLAAAPSAGAIHITTHAVSNEEQPSLSALVLQREHDDEGLLYVHEIAGLQLRSTRMVFIAACEAARAGRKGREGTATIGRAFLAAGAPVVIASTRDLNDAVAAAIVDEFYRRVDAGADPVTALRLTQLSMKGRFAPVDWATLQVMGGIASREREPWLSNWK